MHKKAHAFRIKKSEVPPQYLVVTPAYWPGFRYGGPVHSLHLLLKELKRQGFNIQVYTTTLFQKDNMYMERIVDGVPVKYFPISPLSGSYGYSPGLRIHLKNTVQLFNLVIISSTWEYSTYTAMSACTGNNVPFIFIPRGMLQRRTFRSKFWKKYPYYKLLIEHSVNNASYLIFTTELEKIRTEEVINLKAPSIVIPNGIDTKNFKPGKKPKKIRLITVCRLIKRKGLQYLITALENMDIELNIIGEGPELSNLKNLAKSLNVKVNFIGYVKHDNLPRYYQKASIFVLPSLYEGMSNSVLEGMASGLPIITTNTGGTQELIHTNGIIIKKKSPESIKKALNIMINNNLIKEYGENSRKLALKMSWKNIAKQYYKMFKELI